MAVVLAADCRRWGSMVPCSASPAVITASASVAAASVGSAAPMVVVAVMSSSFLIGTLHMETEASIADDRIPSVEAKHTQFVVDWVVDTYFVAVETSCFPAVDAVVAVVVPLAADTAAAPAFAPGSCPEAPALAAASTRRSRTAAAIAAAAVWPCRHSARS